MSEPVEDYFGEVPVPESEEEDDAANDETFGVDTDDIIAGDPESDVAWKSGHEELAARIEREKEAILRKQDPAPEPVSAQPPDKVAAPPPQHQYTVQQLQTMYAHKVQAHQQHYAMVQQQQRVFTEQRQHMMLQCQTYLRQNPSAGAQVQARQQQLVMQQQMQMGQLQQQLQAIHHSIVQIQAALQAHAKPSAPPPPPPPVPQGQQVAAGPPAHGSVPAGAGAQAEMQGARKAPGGRMEEIERQMAAAGLGPRAHASSNGLQASGASASAGALEGRGPKDPRAVGSRYGGQYNTRQAPRGGANGADPPRGIDGRPGSGPRPPARRRLEGMTDRDLELVLRMHLRQLETAVPYKDEYYAFALKEKDAAGASDAFERLANIVNGMDPASTRGKRSGPKGARLLSTAGDDDDTHSVTSTVHTPENMSTLASALGTLQVWNPKAPRKQVDFGATSEPTDGNSSSVSASDKLLREDDRIVVRFAVEEGYDVLAELHDVVRRKSNASVDTLIKSLFNLLRIPVKANAAVDAEGDAFFVRMCGFGKGKQFIARVFPILKPRHQFAVACAVMRNLHYLARGESKSSGCDKNSTDAFWLVINNYVREGGADSWAAVDLLRRFDEAQADQADGVVVALRSEVGASLVYAAMQRVYGALSGDEFEDDTTANVSAVMAGLCDAIDRSLGALFQQAHSSALVWQVAAMLDALAPPEQQARLRATLKRLLEEGVAPPPPAA